MLPSRRGGSGTGSLGTVIFGSALSSSMRRSMAPDARWTSLHTSLSEAADAATNMA